MFSYDANNRLTQITTPEPPLLRGTTPEINSPFEKGGLRGLFTFAYDKAGRRTNLTFPNGIKTTYTYDNIGRLTNLTHKTTNQEIIASFAYSMDKVGNRLSKTETDTKTQYAYDAIYRLTQAVPTKLTYKEKDKAQENKAEYFSYDAVGNRLRGPETKDFYSYNQINQLTEDRKNSYEYDKNGNLTKKTEKDDDEKTKIWTYTYDYENRLIKVVEQKEDETKTVSFKYDPFGRRIEKSATEQEDGKTETKTYSYGYDNEDVILEYNEKNEITRYVHGPGIDEPISIERKGEVYYYHADGLGSITALTDKKQKVVESYSYSSFGGIKKQGDKTKNTYAFTGRIWDEDVKLYDYRTRPYDYKIGRFTTYDPSLYLRGSPEIPYLRDSFLTTPQHLNPYIYTVNNPIRFTDPMGLAIYICNRKTTWGIGNHAYLWDDSVGTGISCGWGPNSHNEQGPTKDSCIKIAGSDGKEREIMTCCEKKNSGSKIWLPGIKDCHTLAGDCITGSGLINPGAPGGRLGQPCDVCPTK